MTGTYEPIHVRETADGVCFSLHVQPRASRNGVTGIQDGSVRIRITSPPVDGAANEQCVSLLAGLLRVRMRDITIVSGETSRHKTVRVAGITAEQLREVIAVQFK
jgi:uncharacterized protein